ncbi:MAG: FAD-dependent oxidoreductase [Rickettsiales bacterium]|nr:FAD-dependent oxidoreductase [Rickettsiales bacterium]
MEDKQKAILKPDFCIIGAGSGGLSFAAGAVQMGASVVLLERNKMGGDCLNYGCVPSKALISAAKIAHKIKLAEEFGWSIDKAKVNFKKVHDHVRSVIDAIAPNDSVDRFEKLGAHVILKEGKFIDEETIELDNQLIKAKRFIIATGTSPFIPSIKGLPSVPYHTNETIFDLQELPEHLVVIGGGPIGIEMAQSFSRLGSKVTVLEAFTALPKDDPEITSKLKNILNKDGVEIYEHVQILEIEKSKNDIHITYKVEEGKEEQIIASHVLVATGRRPNIKSLDLEKAKINSSLRGIIVNEHLQTSNSKVYAIGDCSGGYQFTHVAGYHASLAIKNSIFRLRSKVYTQAIPWVTYTDPELAHVGFLESQLKEQNIDYKVLHMGFNENDRAQAERETEGSIKILVSPRGKIFGATILGIGAGELIYPWVMAIQNNLNISAVANSIAPYPTLSDINKRVAGSYYIDKIFSPFMKKIVKGLMWLTR